jgi:hypothetical protein
VVKHLEVDGVQINWEPGLVEIRILRISLANIESNKAWIEEAF